MKRKLSREHIRYRFDCIMSRGPIALSLLLFALVITTVGLIGIVAYFVTEEGGLGYQLWNSFMHTLDPGTLAGNNTNNIPYLVLMTLSTLSGLFLTSVLIGIITTGVESKLEDLRRGTSVVQEENHTVIIGFDDNVYTLLRELIEANSNKKDFCVVILGTESKETIEEAVHAHIAETGTSRIICRSGKLYEAHSLARCSVETCRSVIINVHHDAEIIKILLALAAYVQDRKTVHPDLCFITALQDEQYIETAEIAGSGRAKIIFAKDAIARIIANTCRQHGLSQVLTELFNFSENEFYFEHIPALVGKSFRTALLSFSNAIPVGLFIDGRVRLNPPADTVIGKNDQLIMLELDDGAYHFHAPKDVDESGIISGDSICAQASKQLLILGSNDKLPLILHEYDKFVKPKTPVFIVDEDMDKNALGSYGNLDVRFCEQPITRDLLYRFLDSGADNLLLLNDDSLPPESSDSQTLLRLILLRDISDKSGIYFSITTELRSADNQRLATCARVDDFIIGSNFTSLLTAQISENPHMLPLITELLDESGSELYMKPANIYVPTGKSVDLYTLSESAARRREIFIGYRLADSKQSQVVVNPSKTKTVTFGPEDQIVVIAEN